MRKRVDTKTATTIAVKAAVPYIPTMAFALFANAIDSLS